MSTLHDVTKVYDSVKTMTALFGATAKFNQEFAVRFTDIGKSMRKELGIRRKRDALKLPPETELTPMAEQKFNEFKMWLKTQHEAFAKLMRA